MSRKRGALDFLGAGNPGYVPDPETERGWFLRDDGRWAPPNDDVTGTVTWDDLRFPAQGINPAGAASPPTVDNTDGTLLFPQNADSVVSIIAQMPHAWKEGSYIVPHVHWSKTSSAAGTVAWKCEYSMAGPGEVFPAFQELATVTTTAGGTPDNDTADEHLISSFGSLDMTGKKISTVLKFKVTRDVSEDTYGTDAKLYEFDIHWQSDASGSNQEFIK